MSDTFPSRSTSLVLLASASLLAAYFAYQIVLSVHNAFFGPLSKYPGPKLRALTIIPYAWHVARGQQHKDFEQLHAKYGPVVRYGPNHIIFLGTHQSFKDLYGFRKGGAISKDPLFYEGVKAFAPSVATARTEDHSRQRKIFSNAFSDRALKAQEPLIKSWSMKLAEKLGERNGEKVDLLKYYNCTTFDIMGDLTFGESLNMLEDSEYVPWVASIFAGIRGATIMRAFKYLGSLPRFLIEDVLFETKAVRAKLLEHWRYSAERVDARLARNATKPDIWSLLEGREKEHGGLSQAEHHSNGNVFMIAGTETTATALSGTTYYLLRNPEALSKLTAEIRGAVLSQDDLRLENLARLKYLHAVLQEGLRMYPPAPVDLPRIVPPGGVTIDGNYIPADTVTGISHYATYRSEDNFTLPNEFHPERWLGDSRFAKDKLDAVEPFSIGPRNCLGKVRLPGHSV